MIKILGPWKQLICLDCNCKCQNTLEFYRTDAKHNAIVTISFSSIVKNYSIDFSMDYYDASCYGIGLTPEEVKELADQKLIKIGFILIDDQNKYDKLMVMK